MFLRAVRRGILTDKDKDIILTFLCSFLSVWRTDPTWCIEGQLNDIVLLLDAKLALLGARYTLYSQRHITATSE